MKRIKIVTLLDGAIDQEAHVYGKWAAHKAYRPRPDYADSWVVTFIPNGRCIVEATGPLTESEAIMVALHLDATPLDVWLNPEANVPEEQPDYVHWIAEAVIAEALA